YAGGVGIPQPDGTLAYSHTNCSWTTAAPPACPSNQIGEVNMNLRLKVPAGSPTFSVHSDSAPTVYINGNPPRDSAPVRKLEHDLWAMNQIDPYNSLTPA